MRRVHTLVLVLLSVGSGVAGAQPPPAEHVDVPAVAPRTTSIELFWDGSRWWIAGAQWNDECPGNPIPKWYLP